MKPYLLLALIFIGLLSSTEVQIRSAMLLLSGPYAAVFWVFVVLLLFVVTTGILQHVFHRTGLIVPANVMYVVHLMFVVPWLLTMPFKSRISVMCPN